MVVATRDCFTILERRESPPCRGPSSVRIRCTLSRAYSSCQLGGGCLTHRDEDPVKDEQTFFVYDPSIFLRYEDLSSAVQGMLASMPLLQGVDISSDNWLAHGVLEGLPASMLNWARRDHHDGLTGVRYQFSVVMAMEVNFVYSEPKAVVRACAETFMQNVQLGSADQCSICMEDFSFESAGVDAISSPVNLPCSHPFHIRCITMWLFKGQTCPVCAMTWWGSCPRLGHTSLARRTSHFGCIWIIGQALPLLARQGYGRDQGIWMCGKLASEFALASFCLLLMESKFRSPPPARICVPRPARLGKVAIKPNTPFVSSCCCCYHELKVPSPWLDLIVPELSFLIRTIADYQI